MFFIVPAHPPHFNSMPAFVLDNEISRKVHIWPKKIKIFLCFKRAYLNVPNSVLYSASTGLDRGQLKNLE